MAHNAEQYTQTKYVYIEIHVPVLTRRLRLIPILQMFSRCS